MIQFISIGDNVRIDAIRNCLKKEVIIGSNVHLGVNYYVNGSYGFKLKISISSGCRIFTSSDD